MELIIFIGIQASGKSTFYKEKFFKTHVRINLDMLRTRRRESSLFTKCLELKQRVVVDNTNPSKEDRKRYILPAKKSGYTIIGYYFSSKIAEAFQRNKARSGKECISEVGIRATRNRMIIPSYDEGFDELFYVYINKQSNFVGRKWKESNSQT